MNNTFFITPQIPFQLYLLIQSNKLNKNIIWTNEEKLFLNQINKLFDFSNLLTLNDREIVKSILNKISNINQNKIYKLDEKLLFSRIYELSQTTNYNYYYYYLLINRGYTQIINPYKIDFIDVSVGLTDIGSIKESEIQFFNSMSDDQKYEYINEKIQINKQELGILKKKDDITSLIFNKQLNHYIFNKSRVNSKINSITQILSSKSILYNLLENEPFIPYSQTFRFDINYQELKETIQNFNRNSKSKYFVIKPSMGTLSDGIGYFTKKNLNSDFIYKWINDPKNNEYASNIDINNPQKNQYIYWIISDFIQSFLWKKKEPSKILNNSILLKNPYLKKLTQPILNQLNFNDTIGRINKFRFHCLWTIHNNEFKSYLFNQADCEISSIEFTEFSEKTLKLSNIRDFYNELFNINFNTQKFNDIIKNGFQNEYEQRFELASVGSDLDFNQIANENTYPLGKNAWNNIVIPKMINLVNQMVNKTNKYLSCLNKYNKNCKNKNCGCFSHFALDIIIDSNNNPFLLEANTRPFIGYDKLWSKYDPEFKSLLNVDQFINAIFNITVDSINNNYKFISPYYNNFIVTKSFKFNDPYSLKKIYVPLSLGIKTSSTSNVYKKIYDILEKNNYNTYVYPKYIHNKLIKNVIGFRGMSSVTKYLMTKIGELGKNQFLKMLRDLFPYDTKMKLLNRIPTLGFYLGDKTQMTKIIKTKLKNWTTIIPYSDVINNTDSDIDIINKLNKINGKIIAKPAYGQQGKGIIISDNKQYLLNQIKNNDTWVISKYLDNPYLIKLNKIGVSGVIYNDTYGRKAHIRSYVLVYVNDKQLSIYMYKYSLIFCAVKEYNTCTDNDKDYCNLTNLYFGSKYYTNILNKNQDDAYKDLSIKLQEYFNNEQYYKINNELKRIIKSVIFATKDNLNCLNDGKCYQYIALDFHIENENDQPKPYLLEINATPGLKAPEYQWNGIDNYLESILNIVLKTKILSNNKNLFQYLPHYLSSEIKNKEIMKIIRKFKKYNDIHECASDNKHQELKDILRKSKVKNRSYLTNKKDMCSALMI